MYFIQLLELSLLAGLTVSLWTVRVAPPITTRTDYVRVNASGTVPQCGGS